MGGVAHEEGFCCWWLNAISSHPSEGWNVFSFKQSEDVSEALKFTNTCSSLLFHQMVQVRHFYVKCATRLTASLQIFSHRWGGSVLPHTEWEWNWWNPTDCRFKMAEEVHNSKSLEQNGRINLYWAVVCVFALHSEAHQASWFATPPPQSLQYTHHSNTLMKPPLCKIRLYCCLWT